MYARRTYVPEDDVFAVNDKVQGGVYHYEEVVENDGIAGPLRKHGPLTIQNISQFINRNGHFSNVTQQKKQDDSKQNHGNVSVPSSTSPFLVGIEATHGVGVGFHLTINEIGAEKWADFLRYSEQLLLLILSKHIIISPCLPT